jgi:transposase
MQFYPARALDRAMKIKEVLTRAMSGQITWIQAAEIIGITDRSMRRWRRRLERDGYSGLFDRRMQRPSPKRVPLARVEKVLRLYREQYFDLNVKHFVEKLHADHDIQLSYTWVKTALQTAGLVKRYSKRGKHRKRRERRPIPGMMLHVDGSRHRWLPGVDEYYDLIVVFDDATSQVYYARLVAEESTATVMTALKHVVEQRGIFCSLYADRGSHLAYTPEAGGPPDRDRRTQLGRALEQLGVELILANSPQARGRCERLFGTWQGRLPQELRLRGIHTVEEANEFLRSEWIAIHDHLFSVPATQAGSAFLPYRGSQLDKIFSYQEERTVGNDNTVRFDNRHLQIPQQTFRFSLARCRVLVCEHLDQTLSIYYGPHLLARYDTGGALLVNKSAHPRQRRWNRKSWMNSQLKPRMPTAASVQHKERKKDQKRKKVVA